MQSIIGIAVLLAVALLLSDKRSAINKRTVIIAFLLQASLGALVLYVPAGKEFLYAITTGVQQIIAYSDKGIEFLFGEVGNKSLGFIFAFNVLPVIVFFSSPITILYHLGIMTRVVRLIGGGLQKLLKTSRPESMSAAANIFAGQTEAPLVVKPYIPSMTRSELYYYGRWISIHCGFRQYGRLCRPRC